MQATAQHPHHSRNRDGEASGYSRLLVSAIRPNSYNPNRMDDDEFAELVAEVRHLGKLPKPVVVRPIGDGFEIVDGEHGWRAAQECDIAEIDCEVIDADDFEAMRQTYKRNQHGTHNPVLQGRMFRQMMQTQNLSQRKLAEEIDVSEGTIRNSLEYAKAADVRNDYAFERLTISQVRAFNRLPVKLGSMWLDGGACLKTLYKKRTIEDVDKCGDWTLEQVARILERLEETGLVDYLDPVSSASGFAEAVQQLVRWNDWEAGWIYAGIERETLRQYTRHHFDGAFHVRERSFFDSAFQTILDPVSGELVLSADEFTKCLEAIQHESASAADFEERLELAVHKKGKTLPENKWNVQRQLQQIEIENKAPDFIKESKLPIEAKVQLLYYWTDCRNGDRIQLNGFQDCSVETFKEFAKQRKVPGDKKDRINHRLEHAMHRMEQDKEADARRDEALQKYTINEFAGQIALRFYGEEKEHEAGRVKMAQVLSQLTRDELLSMYMMYQYVDMREERRRNLMASLHGNIPMEAGA